MDDDVRAWVESAVGGRVVDEHRPPTGGSRVVLLVDVERDDGTRLPLVVRCEGEGSFTGTEVSLAREAAVYRALAPTPVPAPAVVAVSADATVVVLERLAGTADLAPVGAPERAETMRSFADAVATLHSLDPAGLDLPDFDVPRTATDHARLDLAMWARLGARCPLDPLLRYTGAWLWANAPRDVPRTVLVQGDTGPGNFLAEHGRVTGLVDWELAHLGDPMDDWAWIDMRADPSELHELHERYTARCGIGVDAARVAYYRLAVDYRCAITTSLAVARGGGARGWAPYLLATQRYLDGVTTRLGEQLPAELTRVDVPGGESPRTELYDELLDGIRAAVRHVEGDDVREQTRNLQILVRHLRAYDRIGVELDAADEDDRSTTFGSAIDDSTLGDAAEAAGQTGDAGMLAHLLRRHARRRQLWADLLDRPGRD